MLLLCLLDIQELELLSWEGELCSFGNTADAGLGPLVCWAVGWSGRGGGGRVLVVIFLFASLRKMIIDSIEQSRT